VLRLRLATAAILIPILAVALWYGHPVLGLLIALIVLLAAAETADLLRRAGLPVNGPVVIGLGLLAVGEAALSASYGDVALAVWVILVLVACAIVSLTTSDMRQALLGWAGMVFGALYVGMLAFLLRISLTVVETGAEGRLAESLDPGRAWLLVLVLGVWAYDSLAYVTGRLIGRGRFFAQISPHKTLTGALGGWIGAIVACTSLGYAIGRPVEGLGVGVVVGLAAPVGDLSQSILKRAAGVKDSGQLIPGHGGMLDRVDSFIIAAPVVWLYLAAAGLV
jgi:phosphatidate cytidylyltransferase